MFSQVANASKPVSSVKYLSAVGETTPKSTKKQISNDDWLNDYYPKDEGKQIESIITLKSISKSLDLFYNFEAREVLLRKMNEREMRKQKILDTYLVRFVQNQIDYLLENEYEGCYDYEDLLWTEKIKCKI